MTDAPKIDTQAPDTIWAIRTCIDGAVELGSWADTVRYYGGGDEFIRADLADARAAAAAMAMRERCADMVEREGHSLHVAIRHAPLPDPAALDRLIAERVREAVEAALDAVHEADSLELAMHGTTKIAERIEAQIAVLDSKEGC